MNCREETNERSVPEKDRRCDRCAMTAGIPKPDRTTNGAVRLFIGIPLAAALRAELVRFLAPVPLPGRLVPPDKWHLTLRFLGDTSQDQLSRLREVLRTAPLPASFDIAFGTLGAFPRPARASVLWLGTSSGLEKLNELARMVEAAVQRAGFAAETRPFASHLTLSRLQPPRDVRDIIAAVEPFQRRMHVSDIVLFRSHLGRGPSRYEAVDTFSLSTSEAGTSA